MGHATLPFTQVLASASYVLGPLLQPTTYHLAKLPIVSLSCTHALTELTLQRLTFFPLAIPGAQLLDQASYAAQQVELHSLQYLNKSRVWPDRSQKTSAVCGVHVLFRHCIAVIRRHMVLQTLVLKMESKQMKIMQARLAVQTSLQMSLQMMKV